MEEEQENDEEDYVEPVQEDNDQPNIDDFAFDFGTEPKKGQEPIGVEMPIMDMPINRFDLGLTF